MKKTEKLFIIVLLLIGLVLLVIISRTLFARTDLSSRCSTLRLCQIPSEIERHEAEDEFGAGESSLCRSGFYGKKPVWKLNEKKDTASKMSKEEASSSEE